MTAEENKISILKKYITEFVPPDHKVSQVTPAEFDELSVEGYLQPFLNSMQEYSDQQTKELTRINEVQQQHISEQDDLIYELTNNCKELREEVERLRADKTCNHEQVDVVRHAVKCKECNQVFETKY